jgi:2-aminoethylphosphonate-pyruvate transaminase
MATVRATLAELGVRALLGMPETSCVLHAFELPQGHTYQALHDALKARGFIIYAGQAGLSERLFRISAMGDISGEDMARLCRALREVLSP